MLKENYIKNGGFKDILNFIKNNMNNSSKNENNLRNLKEIAIKSEQFGINEFTFLSTKIDNLNHIINLKNEIGLNEGEKIKAMTNYIIGDESIFYLAMSIIVPLMKQ